MTASPQRLLQRCIVLVSPDEALRERIRTRLQALQWTVSPVAGGAEAVAMLSAGAPEAMIVDHWLPDLEVGEFMQYVAALCPQTDLLHIDGTNTSFTARSLRRNELVHTLRAVLNEANESMVTSEGATPAAVESSRAAGQSSSEAREQPVSQVPTVVMHLPEVVGNSPGIRELSRMVRLVAPHMATVLVLGETGTGKELVAKAVHSLSPRAAKPFVVLNCAAIPEHLLEAELFGHTRGAFTGAVTSRIGRIEAAHGGTLFLDEIGEMPLALQAKMLRFLESGEVQRVGDNETSRVEVRIVAATHQPLLAHAGENRFRLDLYHRLAVFPVEIPALRERRDDIPMLAEHFLTTLATAEPRKQLTQEALDRLCEYTWHGNVRELCHVLHRAAIMAGPAPLITPEHLRMRELNRV